MNATLPVGDLGPDPLCTAAPRPLPTRGTPVSRKEGSALRPEVPLGPETPGQPGSREKAANGHAEPGPPSEARPGGSRAQKEGRRGRTLVPLTSNGFGHVLDFL